MEILALILYFIAARGMLLFIAMIFVCIGLGTLRARAKRFRWAATIVFFAALGFTLLTLINIIRPHAFDGYLVATYGKKADARVLNKETTNNTFNDQPVERYNVIFRTEAGETVETHFETWDFNIYPSANSVRYPQPGQSFRVAYLSIYPKAFLILTDETSEYQSAQQCADILANIEQRRNKYLFDKKDPTFLAEYAAALTEGVRQNCGPTLSEELRSIAGEGSK